LWYLGREEEEDGGEGGEEEEEGGAGREEEREGGEEEGEEREEELDEPAHGHPGGEPTAAGGTDRALEGGRRGLLAKIR
jgi:hypothetical protein